MENNNNHIILDFEPISRRYYFPKEKTIYHVLTNSGIQIRTLCGGVGRCGKCKLQIKKGTEILNPHSQSEIEILNKTELKEGWRLACQTRINEAKIKQVKLSKPPHIIVFLPDELLIEDFKILTSGIKKEIKIFPNVKKFYISVENASLDNPIPDLERILSAINSISKKQRKRGDYEVELEVLKNISELLREQSNELTITILDASKIIHCEPKNKVEENYGVAFDIGTTTIVGYLINLNDGKTYAIASMLNPQTAYGEDLITRITYVKDHKDGLQKLNSIVIKALNKLILKLCSEAKITPSQIFEITVVGNSVMHHLFLGLSPISIGLSPYVPVVQQSLNVTPKNVSLNMHPYGNIYILPLIAGFVGADTIGVILSSKIDEELDLTLAIDIGTNGEIIIGNKDVLVTGSCAAGSALEGAHIKDGMRAAGGAIDTINIDPQTLDVSFTTIKNRTPIGICGSGLIDAIAELLKSKALTRSGAFNKELIDNDRFLHRDNKLEFIIANQSETAIGREITLSQKDIREIQMAKAAFFSGTRILLDYLRKKYKTNYEINQIFLAGAFGNYINKESAKFIGMIPDIPSERIFQIGNAAGIGAINCLLNKELRMKAQDLLEEINYVEIALEKNFQREYAEAMYFPHLNLDFFPNLDVYKDIPKK
ncbi:MAG: ASKHA domain-containing protein [Candidatus Odinarchaeota archaeon]